MIGWPAIRACEVATEVRRPPNLLDKCRILCENQDVKIKPYSFFALDIIRVNMKALTNG